MARKRSELANARKTAGLTQEALAARLGVDRATVGRWESGATDPHAWARPRLARALEISTAELAEMLRRSGAPGTPDRPGDLASASAMAFNADVQRREFLAGVAVAAVGAAAPESLVRLLDGLHTSPPRRVGLSEIEAVEAAADTYMRFDLARNGEVAASFANNALHWATKLLDSDMSASNRERLCSAVALLADRLGWSMYDSGDSARAGKLLTFALDHASRGADRDLRAHVMLDLSTVMTDSGYPRDGVEILTAALGDEQVSAAERANLHAVCARHCASAEKRVLGLRHAELSREMISRDDDVRGPDWARRIVYSPGHHDSALGLALFALDENHLARQSLTAALSELDGERTRTGLRCRIRLAILNFRERAHSAGEAEGYRAISRATGIQSTRIRADLAMLHANAIEYGAPGLAASIVPLLQV